MTKSTVALLVATIVLSCAGCLQEEIPSRYRQAVEIWPVEFRVSNERDSKDPTSVFCYLTLRVKNYGDLPIAKFTLVDLKLGSESRGYFSQKDYTKRPSNAILLPQAAFDLEFHFVMNPDWHIPKYNAGSEDFEICPEVIYQTKEGLGHKTLYRYTCNWKYSKKSFKLSYFSIYSIDNNTESVRQGTRK